MFEQCGDKVWLAAVSGGPDSMALLALCLEQGIRVEAAHVNYHHRLQAEEEEEYVRTFCRERGIPFHVLSDAFTWEGNFEAEARKYRYEWFRQLVKEHGLAGVMTGHQEDDLLETYVMQKEKGLTPVYYGLQEIMYWQEMTVYRPLLSCTKRELETYCDSHGIRYYIDHTNYADDLTRSRIRTHVVSQMTPAERRAMREEIRANNAELQHRRTQAKALSDEHGILLQAYGEAEEEVRLTALRQMCETAHGRHRTDTYYREIDRKILNGEQMIKDADGSFLITEQGYVHPAVCPVSYADVYTDEASLRTAQTPYYRVENGAPGVFAVTLHEDDYPVTIRTFRDGDRVHMRYGTKKVSRFFIDRHIPPYERLTWPVMVNASGTVILVPGLGCDVEHYSVNPTICVIKL